MIRKAQILYPILKCYLAYYHGSEIEEESMSYLDYIQQITDGGAWGDPIT